MPNKLNKKYREEKEVQKPKNKGKKKSRSQKCNGKEEKQEEEQMSVAEKIVRADVTTLKKAAKVLSDRAGYLIEITNEDEYEKALALMDEIIEDYDNQQVLFELLSNSIERWEESSPEFTDFNKRISEGDPAVSVLRVLMDHHDLGVADLPEIGSNSLVSKILNGRDRQLTRNHIDSLSQRFNISPALFFNS